VAAAGVELEGGGDAEDATADHEDTHAGNVARRWCDRSAPRP
jgi:hypothetical protein